MLAIDALYTLSHWDVSTLVPRALKRVRIPEDPNHGYASCLTTLGFQSSDPLNMEHAFIGTTTGNLHFYSLRDKAVLAHHVKR